MYVLRDNLKYIYWTIQNTIFSLPYLKQKWTHDPPFQSLLKYGLEKCPMLAHGKMRTNAEQINLYTYFCKPNNFLTMAIETSYPRDFLPHSPLHVFKKIIFFIFLLSNLWYYLHLNQTLLEVVCKLSSPCGIIILFTIMNEDSVGWYVFNVAGKNQNLPATLAGRF